MKEMQNKLQKIIEEFACTTGTLHKTEPCGNLLSLVCQSGVPEFLLDKISMIPFGKGIAGVAAQTKEPIELCNLQQNLGGVAKEDARKTGVSGSLAVPILANDHKTVLGTIGIGKSEPYEFSNQEKARLTELGNTFLKAL